MSRFAFHKSAVVGLLVFGSQFLVQAQTTSSGTAGLTVTTGIVGVTSTQTAQLNVLNLQAVRSRCDRRGLSGDARILR